MRLGQQMKLAPRMIQSMEILQMPLAQLEERIEQELSTNPTLELVEPTADAETLRRQAEQDRRDGSEATREMEAGGEGGDDFERLSNLSEEYGDDWASNTAEGAGATAASGASHSDDFASRRARSAAGERDAKMDAMANAAERTASLYSQLIDQWRMAEVDAAVHAVGDALIGLIDADGYLRADDATLHTQLAADESLELPEGAALDVDLIGRAIYHLQLHLEPPGLAARDLKDCILLQIDAKLRNDPDADRESLETLFTLVDEHLADIEANRLPKIARAMGMEIGEVQALIGRLRQFHPHPGRLLADEGVHGITPDAVIEYDEDTGTYTATLTHSRIPPLQISPTYGAGSRGEIDAGGDGTGGSAEAAAVMTAARSDKATRDFVKQNLDSARWLMDAIQQRNATLLRVIAVVLNAQHAFFEEGPAALRPLPMTGVADQLGVHVATVSRAVSEKYLQTPRGILPLRMFFSGGTETAEGEAMSWTAMQQKLKDIIDNEDKSKPLSDDALVEKLKEQGIDIARRTVAKYRGGLNIPTARQRKQYG